MDIYHGYFSLSIFVQLGLQCLTRRGQKGVWSSLVKIIQILLKAGPNGINNVFFLDISKHKSKPVSKRLIN